MLIVNKRKLTEESMLSVRDKIKMIAGASNPDSQETLGVIKNIRKLLAMAKIIMPLGPEQSPLDCPAQKALYDALKVVGKQYVEEKARNICHDLLQIVEDIEFMYELTDKLNRLGDEYNDSYNGYGYDIYSYIISREQEIN